MIDYRYVVAAAILLAAGCARDAAPAAVTPAAKVQSPVTEASLTTITLTADAERRLGIQTAPVQHAAVSRMRTISGELVAPAGAATVVAAPFAGTLEGAAPLPAAGETIAGGRAMFTLIPVAPAERDAGIDAERAAAEATVRQEAAASRLQRARQLAADGSGSRRAAEDAQEALGIADADLKAASDRLALARRGSRSTAGVPMTAPHAGIVRAVHATPGQTVAAGTPLFEVMRLDVLWVRVPVFVGEADDVDPRAAAQIVPLGGGTAAPVATAAPIAAPPSADPATATIDLYFALANRDGRLRPGQRVGVRLAQRATANRLVAPRDAILHDAYGGTWVYEAAAARTYVRRRVAIADMVDAYAVLDQGPEPGTQVVTDGAAELFGTEFGAGK